MGLPTMARGRWQVTGAMAWAVLAVLALAVTVWVAQRALGDASDVVIRGEGDALLGTLATELVENGAPPSADALARALEAHREEGLRYVALVGRDFRPWLEAGAATIADAEAKLGVTTQRGSRVRMSGVMMPRRPPRGLLPHPDHEPGAHRGPPFAGMPPPVLVIELEPPVIAELRRDLGRVQLVGLLAGSVLLAFAIAWSRNAARLAALEQRAARDERLVALGGMSSVMAHELRNPLASLKGHAQLLAEDLEGKPKAKAERVVAEAERLEALTSSLLDFVRDGPLDAGEVTPSELAARAIEHLGAARVEIDVAAAPRVVRGDVPRLVRAVANLVDNAWKASPEGRAVELRVAAADAGAVRIDVRDHGAGLPPGSEASIFEPFVTTRTKGTGLGLAVARRIAEQHGGTLTATNHAGGGAVFTLRLPRDARSEGG